MSSTHTYSIPGREVDVALNPEDLQDGMDAETLKRKYDESVKPNAGRASVHQEDLSDMVNEHNERQTKKRSRRDDSSRRDFKF